MQNQPASKSPYQAHQAKAKGLLQTACNVSVSTRVGGGTVHDAVNAVRKYLHSAKPAYEVLRTAHQLARAADAHRSVAEALRVTLVKCNEDYAPAEVREARAAVAAAEARLAPLAKASELAYQRAEAAREELLYAKEYLSELLGVS